MEDIERGNVGQILIKDMSRLGRDHLRVGLFLEQLREQGVRLIAVAEGIDTAKGEDDFMPFRNIFAEWHAEQYGYSKYAEYVTLRPGSGLTEHTMIYGATGSGKTRGFVKPFILQTARRKESMVLVDPKGEIYESMSAFLKEEGYEVRMFNLLDMENSDAWNCLSEIEHDKDLVQSIAEVIIKNTSNAKGKR